MISLVCFAGVPAGAQQDAALQELDAFWARVSRAVAEGDYDAYAASYHPDAVLVNGLDGKSYPIADALEGWREGFEDTRAGVIEASVEFRFTARFHDASTAHETGFFRYVSRTPGGSSVEQILRFEALLVKKGEWKMLMEFQRSLSSRDDWDAAGGTPGQ